MDLIVTDATGKPVASHASYTLDLAFGSGENDFDLQVEDAALKAGSRIMTDGTEYGGIIDDTDVDVDGGLSTVTWHGRDWHGVLASKIIEPDRNNDYLTLSGTIPVTCARSSAVRVARPVHRHRRKRRPQDHLPVRPVRGPVQRSGQDAQGKRTQTPVA